MKGRVVSTKMNKTVAVLVERVARHSLYKKTFVRSKKYLVDDPMGVKEGDIVEIVKIRPVSKNKHWKVAKIVGKNLEAMTEEVLKEAAKKTIAEVMPESSENSEQLRKPENQNVRQSDIPDIRSSDFSGTPSNSESSEKKTRKNSKRSK